jgi:hypothetical protein
MSAKLHTVAAQDWPNMPRAVNQAATQLHLEFGDEAIPAEVLQREAERIGGFRKGSVLPSDYCYNIINRASYSFHHLMLVLVERGRYRYVGPGYSYTGPIIWRPKFGTAQQFGSWNAGACTLDLDPRQLKTRNRATA